MRRKRPRASTALLAASLLLAAVATLLLRGHLARLEARARAPEDARTVVASRTDLPRGTVLQEAMLRLERRPAAYAPPGAVGSMPEAIGRTLTAEIAAGELLTETRLARAGPVSSLVPDGLRAIAITAGLPPGAVVPGDRVDVLAVSAERPFAETVASGVEVLLVLEGRAPEDLGSATAVVLLVSPAAAVRLAHARAVAQLTLAIAPPRGAEMLE